MEAPIKLGLARGDAHLRQILKLQAANLPGALDEDTRRSQGFVTAEHDLPLLRRMNAAAPAVIARRGRQLLGYALAMTREFSQDVEACSPLFQRQDALVFERQPLREVNYLMCGQLCVAEEARGRKLSDRMYKYMRGCYHLRFPYCVTGIDARNTRSLRVHERVGFDVLDRFTAPDGREWVLVIWGWEKL